MIEEGGKTHFLRVLKAPRLNTLDKLGIAKPSPCDSHEMAQSAMRINLKLNKIKLSCCIPSRGNDPLFYFFFFLPDLPANDVSTFHKRDCLNVDAQE